MNIIVTFTEDNNNFDKDVDNAPLRHKSKFDLTVNIQDYPVTT